MGKRVIVSVINDLVTDQRVHKTCMTLTEMGFDVLLVGRELKTSPPLEERPYRTHRMKLLFHKGALFYAEFNLRLLFFLLFRRAGLLTANDLDTLPANYLVSKWKRIPLVYDSHEYFTQVPELVHRPAVQKVWKTIESWIFPKLTDVFTVNDSIADLFYRDYGIRPHVVRNVPPEGKVEKRENRKTLGLPADKFILILQGSGINVQRGAEEMVEAMRFLENVLLLIVGGGDVLENLKEKVQRFGLEDKVVFKPRQPYELLMQYTLNADMGLTLDKDTNLNYRFSLPNKLFDYIKAGIPVLASDLPEIRKIIRQYQIGDFIPAHEPRLIANKVKEIVADKAKMENWKRNVTFASYDLTWEKESETIKKVYAKYV